MSKKRLILGGVFATHTEMDENGNVTQRDEFHTRLYWDLWHSGAMMKLKGARLHVLLTIAQHADRNGKGFPGVRRLAELLPYNKDAINKAIKDLIKLGFLEREQQRGYKGKFGNNHYKIKYTIQTDTETSELPCTGNTDADRKLDNQGISPCTGNTDTVKTGDGKPGHKKDISFKKDNNKQEDVVVEDGAPKENEKTSIHSERDLVLLRQKFKKHFNQPLPTETAKQLIDTAEKHGTHISKYLKSVVLRFEKKNETAWNPIGSLVHQVKNNWLINPSSKQEKRPYEVPKDASTLRRAAALEAYQRAQSVGGDQ